MYVSRVKATDKLTVHQEKLNGAHGNNRRISEFFAENVFTEKAMKAYLSEDAFNTVMQAIRTGQKIDRKVADQVASAMKSWAISKGATHFTHWFQPLTGSTAEKHDAFFQLQQTGVGIEAFDSQALVQQEPDASSFPSGGLRNTFEARGYTAWDPTSPAFIMEIGQGKTLCIPTVFISYNGESLDYKAPLLKSLHALEEAAVAVCHYFDKNVTKVIPTLGWEQEYFVVDEALYEARPDLMMSGRTLFGHAPAKGQQLEDHYFASIPERVYAFMLDFETECYRLGIPIKTRHNEVAPAQFECAPYFEEVNVAVDHNQLLMDVMQRVAQRHKLRVLLHEKPFSGINGSGKHCNWSMATDTGKNLLSPGKTPKTNLQFLTFFVNVIKAVHDHADLIRAAIASAGNDHRLGANEAPPAIISVFIGEYMTGVLQEIEARVEPGKFTEEGESQLRLEIHNRIPALMRDNTDRNRTSPFAFTGNKFEVRAVGASQNTAAIMTVLNTIVADTLRDFRQRVDHLMGEGKNREVAIMEVLRVYISQSKKILFEGNNYSPEWHQEAERRGLPNLPTTPLALDALTKKENIALFERHHVFKHDEMHARHEIELEKYIKKLQIEGRVIGEMAMTQIVPAALAYLNKLVSGLEPLQALGISADSRKALAEEISRHVEIIISKVEEMTEARKAANAVDDVRQRALAYCEQVKPYFDQIRYHADKLELIVEDALWPLPKYRELLFVR
ncbi:MAG: glutamine synthetase III [Chitinophagales bacterium]|nr:glutamine synthetase III [Chitinophagales bacterium]MDW8394334.1 glutamine synthetase III [Chitinophagales bacterium]